eukprot:CAMPEP_0202869156 /NCGR_PEP_ID=MMETSP1391-20130828/12019_1 /ASSEMBLY_ACC=CAM_ASM_000867 /TAXON_ID=1034604 /ORGANISM="Chlamydomonas leiostraca, Strain SAG 11-49" /LENGTH=175 /DNA_ID=CAMNT_0049549423 /DNA_START=62 /DNA_END=586 /DNA_ORIENTATION=+
MYAVLHPTSVVEISIAVLIPLLPGVLVSGFYADQLKTWYAKTLRKSSLHPPLWVFAPAWTVLYFCMGLASWMVWQQGGFMNQTIPLAFYGSTLVLQWAWCVVLLKHHRIDWALITAVVLAAFQVSTFLEFAKVVGLPAASVLMGPVCIMCLLILAINYDLMVKNPVRRGSGAERD